MAVLWLGAPYRPHPGNVYGGEISRRRWRSDSFTKTTADERHAGTNGFPPHLFAHIGSGRPIRRSGDAMVDHQLWISHGIGGDRAEPVLPLIVTSETKVLGEPSTPTLGTDR